MSVNEMMNSTFSRSSRLSPPRSGLLAWAGRMARWAAAGAAALCASQSILAAPPLNDAFPGAALSSGSTNIVVASNVDATAQPGEPAHAGNSAAASVWWSWQATDSGPVVVDTLGSEFDTVLAVYQGGAVDALTLVAENDDAGGLATSAAGFLAVEGATYYIAVDGYQGASGVVHLALRLPVQPAGPVIINDPASQSVLGNAGSNVTFSVSATGSYPRFYEWQKNGARVAAGSSASYTITNAVSGDMGNYRVIITNSYGSATSAVAVLKVHSLLAQDAFLGRVSIAGTSQTLNAHSYGATIEAGEPLHDGLSNEASLWWSWTAPQDGMVRLDTAGSLDAEGAALDTVLAIYTGSALSALTPLISNDDESSGFIKTSKLFFRAVAGATYQIAVAGPSEGDITLHLEQFADNDDFASSLLFPSDATTMYDDNTFASVEAGEPKHAENPGGKSVWWHWVAPEDGSFVLDTTGSAIDTVLAVYTGSALNSLALAAEDDNRSDDGASLVKFMASEGVTYRIAVDGYSGADGVAAGRIVLNLNPYHDLNDHFADRTTLSGQTNQVAGTNVGASKEAGEPEHGGNAGGRSVWWTWTARITAPVIISTRGSGFDTTLAVYSGTEVSALALIAENDDTDPANADAGSAVEFLAEAGESYQIAVDGFRSGDGDVSEGAIALSVIQATPPQPGGNDLFANRLSITGQHIAVTGANTEATKEAGEPDHAGNDGGKSVWWSWVAPASTPVAIATLGSDFDTVLAVYQGSSVGALTLVEADHDSAAGSSIVTFLATQGVEYQIAVDGFNDGSGPASGAISLRLRQYDPTAIHANDDFAHATPISDAFLIVAGLNIGATREPEEPAHNGAAQGHSVWWAWTALTNGAVTITTEDSQFDTLLSVYTGSELSALSLVAENDDIGPFDLQSSVTFQAAAGTTYQIAVDGYGGKIGIIKLEVSPAPDQPSVPQIQEGPADQTRFANGGGSANVTFRVVATGSLPLSYQWLRNGQILENETADTLTLASAGLSDIGAYQVTVSNHMGVATSEAADFNWFASSFNNDFNSRILIAGTSIVTQGSVLGASKQASEPHHGGEQGGRSVWWRWIAPASGPAEINTFGSTFDTLLAVYQGADLAHLTLVAENNDRTHDQVSASRVLFHAVAGQEYQIAVDGVKTNTLAGSVVLAVKQPPLADDLNPAISISAPSSPLTRSGPVSFTVTYTDVNFDRSDLSASDISLNRTGTANGSVAVSGSGASRSVVVSNVSGDGSLSISIQAGTAIDAAGNRADAAGPSAAFVADNTRPLAEISAPSLTETRTGPVAYTISYADANLDRITLTASDVQLHRTGTAEGNVSVSSSGATATVTISGITGEGTLGISLNAETALDKAGNTASEAGPSVVFSVIDSVAPPHPGLPDLIAAHDTGVSNMDNITSASILTLEGAAESGNVLTLKEGASVLGQIEVVAGVWSLTLTNLPSGAHSLSATLTDTAGNTSDESEILLLVVDQAPPLISPIPEQAVNEDSVLNVAFQVNDAHSSATVQAASSNVSLIPQASLALSGAGASRALAATPSANAFGSGAVTLTATDLAGNAATLSFNIIVHPVNDAPTLDAIANQSVLQSSGAHGVALGGISAGAGEAQGLTIRALSDNTALVGHPAVAFAAPGAALLTLAPIANAHGRTTISVIVEDDGGAASGGINAVTNRFEVTVQSVNLGPVLQNLLADRLGIYGSFLSFDIPSGSFADPDSGGSLSYSASGLPPGVAFDAPARTFSGAPQAAGVFVIQVTATDAGGLSATDFFQLTVSKAPLTITAENKSKVYGAALPELTAAYSGFVAGDTPASLSSAPVFSTSATPSSNAGSYVISVAGAASPNYEITLAPGVLTVSPALLRITAAYATAVYGDPLPAFTPVFTGFVAGDTAASLDTPVTLTAAASSALSVGIHAIKVAGGDDANYKVERVDGLLTITPAPLLVKGADFSRGHRSRNPELSGAITGLKNGDSILVSYSTPAVFESPVGAYLIIPTVHGPSDVLSRYTLELAVGFLTVLDRVELSGAAFDGYIAEGTVFFDANRNRRLDAGEPSALTGQDGRFTLSFPVADYDQDRNGKLDPVEGVIALTGGVDISTGLPLPGPLSAPLGATVISPLTTLIALALELNPPLAEEEAQRRIKAGLGIPGALDLYHYDPAAALKTNDASALKLMAAAASVQDTAAQIAALLDSASPLPPADLFRQALGAMLGQILSGPLDLSRPEAVRNIINASAPVPSVPAALLQAAAEAIADNNASKNAMAASALAPGEAALAIGKLQGVAQRDLAGVFREATAAGVSVADALALLREAQDNIAKRNAPVGPAAGDARPGRFNFDTQIYQATSLGRSSARITVTRTDGNNGAGKVGLRIHSPAHLPVAPVEFAHREISRTVDILPLIAGSIESDSVGYINLTLEEIVPPGTNAPALGAVTNALLIIRTAPALTDPASVISAPGSQAVFSVAATGFPRPAVQWMKNGSALAGQTNTTLALANLRAEDEGIYWITASNVAGVAVSATASLSLQMAPVIAGGRTNISALRGDAVALQFSVTGSAPLQFQWRKNGADLAGQTNAVLNIGSAQPADSGRYTLVVRNVHGAATSAESILTVSDLPSFASVVRRLDGNLDLSLRLPLGHRYRLEQSSDLKNWSSAAEIVPQTESHEHRVPAPLPAQVFFRLVVIE